MTHFMAGLLGGWTWQAAWAVVTSDLAFILYVVAAVMLVRWLWRSMRWRRILAAAADAFKLVEEEARKTGIKGDQKYWRFLDRVTEEIGRLREEDEARLRSWAAVQAAAAKQGR